MVYSIAFSMSRDLKVTERIGYTILDLFSDIGGIQGLLQSFFSIIVGIFNHGLLDDMLISKLFKYRGSRSKR